MNHQFKQKLGLSLILGAGLFSALSMPAFAEDELSKLMKDDNQWAHPRKDYSNTGYSKLSQINKGNVKNLRLAWSFSTGVNRGHEGAPLVINDIMYVHTAFPNNIYALDLNDNQKIVWSYFPKQDPSIQALLCCDNVNRGLAYGDGKIFLQQNDGKLVALDAKTGKKIWDVQVTDTRVGESNTNAPHVIKDKVITKLQQVDIKYAEELGYRVKLLGITKRTDDGVELRVHPTLIPEKRLVANVNGAMNAVVVKGDAVGPTLYYGAGAGSEPTASAVVADLIDVARLIDASSAQRVPYLAFQPDQVQDLPILPIDQVQSAYYLRLRASDKPGVLAEVTKILGDRAISIDAMMQKEPDENETEADIVILTHITIEKNMNDAIAAIESLAAINGKVVRIRMEELAK